MTESMIYVGLRALHQKAFGGFTGSFRGEAWKQARVMSKCAERNGAVHLFWDDCQIPDESIYQPTLSSLTHGL